MSIKEFFTFSAEKRFAQKLAEGLAKDIPADLKGSKGKPLTVNRITRFIEQACDSAQDFQKTRKMGVISRAMMANSFKWALVERGYSNDFVDMATEALVVALAKRRVD